MHQDWLLYRSQKHPNKTFIQKANHSYSFKEVNDIVYDRMCSLKDYGVNHKSRVAILIIDPLDFIEAYLACYKLGATSIMLNYRFTNSEVTKIIKNNTPDYIICSWKDKTLFEGLKKPIIFFEELSKSHGNCFNEKTDFKPLKDDIQSILLTSGTEGKPKSACLKRIVWFSNLRGHFLGCKKYGVQRHMRQNAPPPESHEMGEGHAHE